MEKNSVVSHSATAIVQERTLYSADNFSVVICNTCGFIAEKKAPADILSITHQTHYCRYCDSHENIYPCKMPYASKLFFQEISALHLKPTFELE